MSGPTARLEMQQAGRTFRRYQKLLDDKVLRPIKNIVIADAVSRGLIENNVGTRTTKGIFNFGANVSIDLGRESASAISEFKTGLRTAADIYAERGQDFESAMRQRAIEAKLVKDLADEYDVTPDTISDISLEGMKQANQAQAKPTEQGEEAPEGTRGRCGYAWDELLSTERRFLRLSMLSMRLRWVQYPRRVRFRLLRRPSQPSAQTKQGQSSLGVNIGVTIPTTKEEKQQIAKDQGEEYFGRLDPPRTHTNPDRPRWHNSKKK
jgi:hypothetical protein